MTGVDAAGSAGRPEYVIPSLDLEGYFARFFADRERDIAELGPSSAPYRPSPAQPPPDPATHGIPDLGAFAAALLADPALLERPGFRAGLDAVQKKFAVFGRLLRSYAPGFKGEGEEEADPATLARLSRIFLRLHRDELDLNALNSAIKLADNALARYRRSPAPSEGERDELALALHEQLGALKEAVHA